MVRLRLDACQVELERELQLLLRVDSPRVSGADRNGRLGASS